MDPRDRALYGITTAGELVGLPAASLRLYESKGLVQPARTDGGTRRYSELDLARIRRISTLMAEGVNLAGVGVVLDLEQRNRDLQAQLDRYLQR